MVIYRVFYFNRLLRYFIFLKKHVGVEGKNMLLRYYVKDRRVRKMLSGYCGSVRVKQRSLTS